jgi:hypothetical protein
MRRGQDGRWRLNVADQPVPSRSFMNIMEVKPSSPTKR